MEVSLLTEIIGNREKQNLVHCHLIKIMTQVIIIAKSSP